MKPKQKAKIGAAPHMEVTNIFCFAAGARKALAASAALVRHRGCAEQAAAHAALAEHAAWAAAHVLLQALGGVFRQCWALKDWGCAFRFCCQVFLQLVSMV